MGIGLLRNVILGPLTRDEVSLKISDFWCDNSWDLSKISFVLPPFIGNKVKSITLPWFSSGDDQAVWNFSVNGDFQSNLPTSFQKISPYPPLYPIGIGFGTSMLAPE